MKIFKKKTVETSNDLYEAYKAEISGQTEKKSFFSLNNVLKLEVLLLTVGFLVLDQNNLSLELNKMGLAKNETLPVSVQCATLEKDLIVQPEDTHQEEVQIREEISMDIADETTYVGNSDIKLLIELLEAEVKANKEKMLRKRIILSQK